MRPFKGGRACALWVPFSTLLLALTACSSGGGGAAGGVTAGVTQTPPAPTFATQTIGTTFAMKGVLLIYSGGGYPSNIALAAGTLQYAGTNTSGVPVYNVMSPAGTYNAQPADGTVIQTVSNDTSVTSLMMTNLTYTAIGMWNVRLLQGGTTYPMAFATGFETPTSGVPTSGTATYVAPANGVTGSILVPSGVGPASTANLAGQANIGVNFSNGAVTGTLSNMTATAATGGAVTPWNNVTLTGTLSGGALSGSTATSIPPAGAGSFGLAAVSTGIFQGALYGPNGQELGLAWMLSESGAASATPTTKLALGAVMATKQ